MSSIQYTIFSRSFSTDSPIFPNISKHYEKIKQHIISLIKEEKKNYYFKTYSFYPPLSVDLSLLVPIKINFQEILFIIKNCEKQLIEEIELFDIYEKIELVDASYSLGLKIIFRSKQKTLLKNEIEKKNNFIHNLPNILKDNINDKNNKAQKKAEITQELEQKFKKTFKDLINIKSNNLNNILFIYIFY